jgi:hypothetical protein
MNTQSKSTPASTISVLSHKYAEASQWLDDCPFDDGQPFYETANATLEQWGEDMLEAARAIGDEAITESIEAAIIEAEYGEFDSAVAFWRYISTWAFYISLKG